VEVYIFYIVLRYASSMRLRGASINSGLRRGTCHVLNASLRRMSAAEEPPSKRAKLEQRRVRQSSSYVHTQGKDC
jgi:hypothetical protein